MPLSILNYGVSKHYAGSQVSDHWATCFDKAKQKNVCSGYTKSVCLSIRLDNEISTYRQQFDFFFDRAKQTKSVFRLPEI